MTKFHSKTEKIPEKTRNVVELSLRSPVKTVIGNSNRVLKSKGKMVFADRRQSK